MDLRTILGILAFASLAFFVIAFAVRWRRHMHLPLSADLSTPKDSTVRGIRYAFTAGMAPWAKESTRLHLFSYVRGILLHIGIFTGLAALCFSPWLEALDASIRFVAGIILILGCIAGVAGALARIAEHNLRVISTRDDHASIWLVSVFMGCFGWAMFTTVAMPVAYAAAAFMLVYAPISKIRHCVYFYFGRLFFGIHIGRRGIVRGLEARHG